MKNKKGFTLIEIIVAMVLLAVIGTSSVVGINYAVDKNKEKKIDKAYSQFDEALDVYLSNHPEIYENLSNNVEGAVVTLEVLKNEGLVKDNAIDPITKEKIDYKNNYYVLSDAVLLENTTGDTENACNGQVGLNVLKSWKELSDEVETAEVIYVCPKDYTSEGGTTSDKIQAYEERIRRLEEQISRINIGNGEKNYVLFDVTSDTSKNAYWPETNTDLWRILDESGDTIELIYTQPIGTNNEVELAPFHKGDTIDLNSSTEKYYYISEGTKFSNYKLKKLDGKMFGFNKDSIIKACNNTETDFENVSYNHNVLLTKKIPISYDSDENLDYNKWGDAAWSSQIDEDCRAGGTKCYLFKTNVSIDTYKNYGCIYRKSNLYKETHLNYSNAFNGWTIEDLFNINYSSSNKDSKRNSLHNAINGDLVGYLKEKQITSGGEEFDDYLSIIDADKTKKDWLSNKSFVVGLSHGITLAYDYTLFNISNGGQVSSETGRVKISDNDNTCGSSSYNCYSYKTVPFIPVISLNISNAEVLTNLDDYTEDYKTKNNCTPDNFGTETCPMLIKFSDNIYSNGTTNGNQKENN